MLYHSPVAELVENAARGVESAWCEIIRRYSPLVISVCRNYGVTGTDADDVGGIVWLRLATGLSRIREPEALPGWLVTTVRRACVTLLRDKRRQVPSEAEIADLVEPEAEVVLLAEERRDAVRDALTRLPKRDRELLVLLFSDPPAPYVEISSTLGIPVGAIGPTRRRCLERMRRTPSIAALLLDERCA